MIRLSNGKIFQEGQIQKVLPLSYEQEGDLFQPTKNTGWRVIFIDGTQTDISASEKLELDKLFKDEKFCKSYAKEAGI